MAIGEPTHFRWRNRIIRIRQRTRSPRERRTTLDYADVLRFLALLAGCSVELDKLTLFKALVTITLDVGEMYEDVVTLLARDEAESLFRIEKLHCTLCHEYSILRATNRPFRFARCKTFYSPALEALASTQVTRFGPLYARAPAKCDPIVPDRPLHHDFERELILRQVGVATVGSFLLGPSPKI